MTFPNAGAGGRSASLPELRGLGDIALPLLRGTHRRRRKVAVALRAEVAILPPVRLARSASDRSAAVPAGRPGIAFGHKPTVAVLPCSGDIPERWRRRCLLQPRYQGVEPTSRREAVRPKAERSWSGRRGGTLPAGGKRPGAPGMRGTTCEARAQEGELDRDRAVRGHRVRDPAVRKALESRWLSSEQIQHPRLRPRRW